MSGNQNTMARRTNLIERTFSNALSLEAFSDDRVMSELTENCERSGSGEFFSVGDGIANAEADSEMFSEDDFHDLV